MCHWCDVKMIYHNIKYHCDVSDFVSHRSLWNMTQLMWLWMMFCDLTESITRIILVPLGYFFLEIKTNIHIYRLTFARRVMSFHSFHAIQYPILGATMCLYQWLWKLFTGSIIVKSMSLAFNWLWPSDDIWPNKFGSTIALVMVCCFMAPSHYIKQCWLLFSKVFWYSPEVNFIVDAKAIYHWYELEIC